MGKEETNCQPARKVTAAGHYFIYAQALIATVKDANQELQEHNAALKERSMELGAVASHSSDADRCLCYSQ